MNNIKSLTLTDRQTCDCEMLLDGSFYPLDSFMNREDYNSVLSSMRLANKKLFPIPITLDVDEKFYRTLKLEDKVELRNKEGFLIAVLKVESLWKPNLKKEAELVYGTTDPLHPAVNYLINIGKEFYIGGEIKKVMLPNHYDYKKYRLSPNDVKKEFKNLGWDKIIAFQTRNPLHRAHFEMTVRSMKNLNANLFLHPVVGPTKPGDIDYFTRVRCYELIIKRYPKKRALLAILPLAMRMGGPREAILHALVRKNYGCTHLIIGRDHAGPGLNSKGRPFYSPFEAQELVKKFERELEIKMIPFQFMVYIPVEKKFRELKNVNKNIEYETISGTKLRGMLDNDLPIPDWFSYTEVIDELKRANPPLHKKGFTIFFTGLSGSGKSTIANGLLNRLLEMGDRSISLLDGDVIRTHLSSELGFSKKHRSINVRRIGYVASEITKNGGIAICAPIAPYEKDRAENRKLISRVGGYFEVFISTPLEKCEERDSKGLYKLARKGVIEQFTGISDPYEVPVSPDLILNSDGQATPNALIDEIIKMLIDKKYLKI